jgi:hypothetical protein
MEALPLLSQRQELLQHKGLDQKNKVENICKGWVLQRRRTFDI